MDRTRALLQERGRVTLRALQREFSKGVDAPVLLHEVERSAASAWSPRTALAQLVAAEILHQRAVLEERFRSSAPARPQSRRALLKLGPYQGTGPSSLK